MGAFDFEDDGGEDFDASEFLRLDQKNCVTKSRKLALLDVEAMLFPKRIIVTSASFAGLGRGFSTRAHRVFANLIETYNDKLPDLIGIAVRECHYAACASAYFCAEMGCHPEIGTPEGYTEVEGWAYTMYNGLANFERYSDRDVFRIGTPITERVSSQTLLNCIALYWFTRASELNQRGAALEAQQWIFEGLDAVSLGDGIEMWDAGVEFSRHGKNDSGMIGISEARSQLARIAANARHSENHSMKADVFTWLDSYTPKFIVIEAAARAIVKQQPITHGTARDWFKEWKKLRSASTQ